MLQIVQSGGEEAGDGFCFERKMNEGSASLGPSERDAESAYEKPGSILTCSDAPGSEISLAGKPFITMKDETKVRFGSRENSKKREVYDRTLFENIMENQGKDQEGMLVDQQMSRDKNTPEFTKSNGGPYKPIKQVLRMAIPRHSENGSRSLVLINS